MATVQLRCDGCNEAERQGQVGQTLDDLRDRLAKVGWISDKANDVDACPRCLGAGRMVAGV